MRTIPARRRGFTLMELLVVLSILALVAALAIPKMIDIYERSRSATQSYALADAMRMIEIFYGINHKYPDGWDALMVDGGAPYTRLSPNLKTPRTFFTTATLTPEQISSLGSGGIGHVFLHDDTITDRSNSGVDRRHLGTGSGHDGTANINTFVVVDKSTGSDGLDMLVNDFGLNPNKSATDTAYTRIMANTYVVFGAGPKSTMVQNTTNEAPILENANSATSYSRVLVVFEVPNTGSSRAKLVGVLGPDGRTKAESAADFNNVNGPQPH